MGKKHSMLQLMAEAADLPGELVPGTSLIELCDDRRILVENHRGVAEYSETLIVVRLCRKELIISGASLHLHRMQKGTLIIGGRIQKLEFRPGGEHV